jgi:hypothetical protein
LISAPIVIDAKNGSDEEEPDLIFFSPITAQVHANKFRIADDDKKFANLSALSNR